MIKVLYFASLGEQLNCSEEELDLPETVSNIEGLVGFLSQRSDTWLEAFSSDKKILFSVNQEMVKNDAPVTHGDEVAFFPPVTGG